MKMVDLLAEQKERERIVAKVDCGKEQGNAILISTKHAVTVKHCVKPAYESGEEILLTIAPEQDGEPDRIKAVIDPEFNADMDEWVMLELERETVQVVIKPFASVEMLKYTIVDTYGYDGNYRAEACWTQLKSIGSANTNGELIQDMIFQVQNSREEDFSGLSGSPIFKENYIIGIVSQQKMVKGKAIDLRGISVRSSMEYMERKKITVKKIQWEEPLHQVKDLKLDEKIGFDKDHTFVAGIISQEQMADQKADKRKPVYYHYQIGKKNKLFSGRIQIIDNVISKLAIDRLVFLTGAGGMGKSQIAREIIYQKLDSYKVIMWFSANTEIELLNEFNNAAIVFKLVDKRKNDFKCIVPVLSAFIDEFASSLIVYDGVDDVPIKFLNETCFFEGSDIIVTTQNSNIDTDEFSVIPVDTFNRKDAESFLMTHSAQRKKTEQDGKTVSYLCALLEYYPLALEYARAYVNKTHNSFADYIQKYRENKYDILDTSVSKYEKTAYTAWKLSYDKAVRDSAYARNILNMVSFLDTHDIPLQEIFVSTEQYVGYDLDKAIEKIKNYSLFSSNEYIANIHGITQEFIRLQMKKSGEYRKYYEKTLQIFSVLMPPKITNASDKELVAKTINHAIKLIMYGCNTNNEDLLAFASNISSMLYVTGSYMQTIEFIQELFKKYGPPEQSFHMLQMITFLSQAYHYAGDKSKSLEILEKYISIVSSSNELIDIQKRKLLSRYKNVKGIVQKEQKKYEDSLKTFSGTLEFLDPLHPATDCEIKCNILMNIGNIYKHLDKCNEALEYYEQALACSNDEKHLLLRIYGNMATVYKKINETEKAIQYYKQCLAFTQELGDQRNECTCLEDLGEYFMDLQQYSTAELYLRKSLKIADKIDFVLGIINASYNLGRLLSLQKNDEDARIYLGLSLEKSHAIKDEELIKRSTDALSMLPV